MQTANRLDGVLAGLEWRPALLTLAAALLLPACGSTDTPAGVCGDGQIDDGERCDDASLNGHYGHCASDCRGPGPRCGDGTVQHDPALGADEDCEATILPLDAPCTNVPNHPE